MNPHSHATTSGKRRGMVELASVERHPLTTRSGLPQGRDGLKGRDHKFLPNDQSAVRAIAQACINVELFTIPLYMSCMYSIWGMHEINTKGTSFYKGRKWPGAATTANPSTPNEQAFNLIFSVFVEEMLHLQMAANIAVALGVKPDFNSSVLQDGNYGWTCYNGGTVIPHIVDLKDTKDFQELPVRFEPLNSNQVKLFLAIEQSYEDARDQMRYPEKYFPVAPFKDQQWTVETLPMFGSIGWMYMCLADYLNIEYDDGSTLWEKTFVPGSVQHDLFNSTDDNHPAMEYRGFDAGLADGVDVEQAKKKVIAMINAITDQGEGSTIAKGKLSAAQLRDVWSWNSPDIDALQKDYISYDSSGVRKSDSDDAKARNQPASAWKLLDGEMDHHKRFEVLGQLLQNGGITTWQDWYVSRGYNPWKVEDLWDGTSPYPGNIPSPQDTVDALNRVGRGAYPYSPLLSQVCAGAIKGITTVLDQYWSDPKVDFPYPSMAGSGDRMAICWALFGQPPDLSLGIPAPDPDKLYHACQGLAFDKSQPRDPDPSIFHTCRGSNGCHAQGGCGYITGGGCGGKAVLRRARAPRSLAGEQNICGQQTSFSAPSDNKCAGFGGCAVPISAHQLFPEVDPDHRGTAGTMILFTFDDQAPHDSHLIDGQNVSFKYGDSVYDKAWEAYTKVMAAYGRDPGEKPHWSDLRIVLPPST